MFIKTAFLTLFSSALVLPHSYASSCNDFFQKQIILRPWDTPNYRPAHDAITSDLYNGEIVSYRKFGENDNKHALFLVTIKGVDPFSGNIRFREAFFKPRVWGDEDGWSRSPMEYVAYHLNVKLGMDYVPPTVYRKGISINWDGQTYSEGSFILKAPNFTALSKLPDEKFPAQHTEVISDHRILAVLLQNQDGHYHNLGTGVHWVDGVTRPVFIDWGASLRAGTNVNLTQYHAYGNSTPVSKIRRKTFEILKLLNPDDLRPAVEAGFLSWDEVNAILSRRDGIIHYFQSKVDDAVKRNESVDKILLPY